MYSGRLGQMRPTFITGHVLSHSEPSPQILPLIILCFPPWKVCMGIASNAGPRVSDVCSIVI